MLLNFVVLVLEGCVFVAFDETSELSPFVRSISLPFRDSFITKALRELFYEAVLVAKGISTVFECVIAMSRSVIFLLG